MFWIRGNFQHSGSSGIEQESEEDEELAFRAGVSPLPRDDCRALNNRPSYTPFLMSRSNLAPGPCAEDRGPRVTVALLPEGGPPRPRRLPGCSLTPTYRDVPARAHGVAPQAYLREVFLTPVSGPDCEAYWSPFPMWLLLLGRCRNRWALPMSSET